MAGLSDPAQRAGLSLREMIPTKRNASPEWEVSLHGTVIGWVRQESVGRSSRPFFRAIGIHQPSGELVNLELSTDREERVETVCQFWLDPLTSKQHLPSRLQARTGT